MTLLKSTLNGVRFLVPSFCFYVVMPEYKKRTLDREKKNGQHQMYAVLTNAFICLMFLSWTDGLYLNQEEI